MRNVMQIPMKRELNGCVGREMSKSEIWKMAVGTDDEELIKEPRKERSEKETKKHYGTRLRADNIRE